jgi:phosphoribosyl-AMP cyclohydrolase
MITKIDFQKSGGLVPVIIQDLKTREVLMLGYQNETAYTKTLDTGFVYFWSRSRNELWLKGETSGDKLKVKKITVDCDNDTVLVEVELLGDGVCHTGSYSCFATKII